MAPGDASLPSSTMSRAQRVTFLAIAGAIVVVVLVVVLVTGGKDSATVGAQGTSAGTVPALTAGKVTKLSYTQGDPVRFTVRADHDDEVHVHGYNIEKPVKAGQPLTIAFKATINGIFEIELHHPDTQIGQLTVEPK
jgi:hypothetical protein